MLQLDEEIGFQLQIEDPSTEPVLVVQTFHVDVEDVEAFISAWSGEALYMKSQPGFISIQLYRGTCGSTTFMCHAAWESAGAFRQAFDDPAFASKLCSYPESVTASPLVYRELAVPEVATKRIWVGS